MGAAWPTAGVAMLAGDAPTSAVAAATNNDSVSLFAITMIPLCFLETVDDQLPAEIRKRFPVGQYFPAFFSPAPEAPDVRGNEAYVSNKPDGQNVLTFHDKYKKMERASHSR
jgi:hypothetical protein